MVFRYEQVHSFGVLDLSIGGSSGISTASAERIRDTDFGEAGRANLNQLPSLQMSRLGRELYATTPGPVRST